MTEQEVKDNLEELLEHKCNTDCAWNGVCKDCKYYKSVRLAKQSLECVRDVAQWLMSLHCTPKRLEQLKKELKEGSNDQGRNQTT